MAGTTGFEPAISGLTGRRVRPLHHVPTAELLYHKKVPVRSKPGSVLPNGSGAHVSWLSLTG